MGQTRKRKQKGGVATELRARKAYLSTLRKGKGPAPTENQLKRLKKAASQIPIGYRTSAILPGSRIRRPTAKAKTALNFKIEQNAERTRGKSAWAAARAQKAAAANASIADLTAAFGGINPFARKKPLSPTMENESPPKKIAGNNT